MKSWISRIDSIGCFILNYALMKKTRTASPTGWGTCGRWYSLRSVLHFRLFLSCIRNLLKSCEGIFSFYGIFSFVLYVVTQGNVILLHHLLSIGFVTWFQNTIIKKGFSFMVVENLLITHKLFQKSDFDLSLFSPNTTIEFNSLLKKIRSWNGST